MSVSSKTSLLNWTVKVDGPRNKSGPFIFGLDSWFDFGHKICGKYSFGNVASVHVKNVKFKRLVLSISWSWLSEIFDCKYLLNTGISRNIQTNRLKRKGAIFTWLYRKCAIRIESWPWLFRQRSFNSQDFQFRNTRLRYNLGHLIYRYLELLYL